MDEQFFNNPEFMNQLAQHVMTNTDFMNQLFASYASTSNSTSANVSHSLMVLTLNHLNPINLVVKCVWLNLTCLNYVLI